MPLARPYPNYTGEPEDEIAVPTGLSQQKEPIMTIEPRSDSDLAHNSEAELERLGITCVPIDNFYYRDFHYTKLEDAKAQAERDRRNGITPVA